MATWARAGSTCEIAGDVLTKTRGGNYNRLATTEETMAAGVHEWEVTLTAGATANQSLALYIGVARENLDVEKGGYSKRGDGWYIRANDGGLWGGGLESADSQGTRAFVIGDRVGVRLDTGDGSLRFFKNGVAFGAGFPAGSIGGPVVAAAELVCPGQCITLVRGAALG